MKHTLTILLFVYCGLLSADHISLGNYQTFDDLFLLADQGDVEAKVRLGIYYYHHGAVDDARYWLINPAKNGHVEAQYRLGVTFLGWGIESENREAIYWINQAAENGHDNAAYMLIVRYTFGIEGFPKDKEKARYWRNKVELLAR